MRGTRVIGNNISLVLKQKGISSNYIADKLGMSEKDVLRILSGRLLLSGNELNDIAGTLDVNSDELLQERDSEEYKKLIHCMGSIKNQDNVERILDYIDSYITLREDSIN